MAADTRTWTVASAKAKFSEVVERAISEGPQAVTRNGKEAVIVVSAAEWKRRTKPTDTLADFLARSPLRGSRLKIERAKDDFRPIDL